ncbi:hypothetical protein EJB05_55119 [Eragrostis curvula]|uniref:Uncharacterized protein n=1 Tax=Eragrostis curvula TaxID=38414 RepID=A0A5J9SKI2_9POAL|nr:hypothetical protein EJB05_55119 [Eragrostis curvula]
MRLLRLRSDGGAAASVMANGKGRRAMTAAERMLHRRSLQRLLAISWPMRSFASSSHAASPRDLLHACARLTPRASWMTLGDREIIKYCDVCSHEAFWVSTKFTTLILMEILIRLLHGTK